MSHRDVYGLPLNTFWMLDRNISRVKAEEDQRLFRLLLTAQSGDQDGVKEFAESLSHEVGNPIIQKAVMAPGAFSRLKTVMGVTDG